MKDHLQALSYKLRRDVPDMIYGAKTGHIGRAAGGRRAKNRWLMQFQSDILNSKVLVSEIEEISGLGAALIRRE